MKKRILVLLLCSTLFCTLLSVTARAGAGYTISTVISCTDRDTATGALDVLPGDTVTLTVSVNGADFVGVACRLTYDEERFELDAVPDGWAQDTGSNVLSYFNVNGSDAYYTDGTALGTFTFLVKATAGEGIGSFTLSDTYVASDWSEGYSEQPAEECGVSNASVNVLSAKTAQKETTEFVAGYSLVLVYTDYGTELYAYDGVPMYDVTSAGYLYNDSSAYAHVYALVVQGSADLSKAAVTAALLGGTVTYSPDVDESGTVDQADAGAVQAVYNTSAMEDMLIILRADRNGDKTVDIFDYAEIIIEIS